MNHTPHTPTLDELDDVQRLADRLDADARSYAGPMRLALTFASERLASHRHETFRSGRARWIATDRALEDGTAASIALGLPMLLPDALEPVTDAEMFADMLEVATFEASTTQGPDEWRDWLARITPADLDDALRLAAALPVMRAIATEDDA